MQNIRARIKEINGHLKNIVAYSIAFLDGIAAKVKADGEISGGARKTQVTSFRKVAVKELVKKEMQLKYDKVTGYAGTGIDGAVAAEVSEFDRMFVIRKDGSWIVQDIQEKVFVGEGAWYVGLADKEALAKTVWTVIYRDRESKLPYIKRCVIEGWIMNKEYLLAPEGAEVLFVSGKPKFTFMLHYVPKPRLKKLQEEFKAQNFAVRGIKTLGLKLSGKEVKKVSEVKD